MVFVGGFQTFAASASVPVACGESSPAGTTESAIPLCTAAVRLDLVFPTFQSAVNDRFLVFAAKIAAGRRWFAPQNAKHPTTYEIQKSILAASSICRAKYSMNSPISSSLCIAR